LHLFLFNITLLFSPPSFSREQQAVAIAQMQAKLLKEKQAKEKASIHMLRQVCKYVNLIKLPYNT
jgi:hypothetical protein